MQKFWDQIETMELQYEQEKLIKFYTFLQLSPVHTNKFIFEHSLPTYKVTTCLSFLKISKLIFAAKYIESYFNLKLCHLLGHPV